MLYAGIDGGQTATIACISASDGVVLGRGVGPAADEVGEPPHSTRLRDALSLSLAAAIANANLPPDTRFARVVAGISGYEGRVYGLPPELPSASVTLMHDARIAHVGALGGQPGVVVIAGTGSVAYARDSAGRESQTGGWGYLFGDEGSAFWIGRTAIERMTRHPGCPSVAALCARFSMATLREVVRAFYSGAISRAALAALAPESIAAAREGRGCACLTEPAYAAATALAALAAQAAGELRTVAFVGGLMRNDWFAERTENDVRMRLPGVVILKPQAEPAVGALLLARST